MTESNNEAEAAVDAMATALGLDLSEDSRPVVITHFKIALDMARHVMEFPLPDECEPAPVYSA